MIRNALFLVLFVFGQVNCQSQFVEEFTIEGKFDFIEFDNLFNIYGVKFSEIFKYKPNGEFMFRYSDEQLGQVGALDITFPLRPMVMYPELNYVILLDNTLSNNRGRINLLSRNIGLGLLGCLSVQNHTWFYDGMSFSLTRMNENFVEVAKTGNLSQILRTELQPNYMVEFANRVYLNNPETGILVFDIFGTYIKTIPLIGLDRFQIFENQIAYFKDNTIYTYDVKNYTESELKLPEECSQALIFKNRIAALQKNCIKVWEVTNP